MAGGRGRGEAGTATVLERGGGDGRTALWMDGDLLNGALYTVSRATAESCLNKAVVEKKRMTLLSGGLRGAQSGGGESLPRTT